MAKQEALFTCQECGRNFYSVASARRASFGDAGCPGCGSSDIDVAPFTPAAVMRERKASTRRLNKISGRD